MSKRKVVINYIYSSFYQLFLIIIPFITAPYLARVLQPEATGINSYVSSVIQIFTLLGLIGLNNYSMREVAYVRDDKKKLSKTYSELLIIRMIMFFVTTIIYLCYASFSEYRIYFYIQMIAIINAFFDVSWLYIGLEEFKVTVTRSFIVKVINVISIFVFIKSPSDLGLFMVISTIYSLIANLLLFSGIKKRIGNYTFKNLEIKKHFWPSIKLFLPQVASLIYLQMDKVMIENLTSSVSNVGFYDQAERIVKMPIALITALSSVMLPRVSNEFRNNNMKAVKDFILMSFRFSLFLAIPLVFGLIAIAPTMIPWFLGKGYSDVIGIMMLLSPIVLFISLSSVSGNQYLTAVNKTKVLTIAAVVSAILNLIVNFILIPRIGPLGAAIGTICAEGTVAFIQLMYIRPIVSFRMLIRNSLKYFFASIVMFIVCYCIGQQVGTTIISTFVQIICGAATYFMVLLILKDQFFIDNVTRVLKTFKNVYDKKLKHKVG